MEANEITTRVDSAKKKQRLDWYEGEIRKRGLALTNIFLELKNDPMRPWSVAHGTFDDYCLEVWGMTPRRIQQIAAGESLKAILSAAAPDLAPVIQKMPEGQTRELADVPPAQRAQVVRVAVQQSQSSGKKLTAKTIQQAKAIVLPPQTPTPAQPLTEHTTPETPAQNTCPHCGQVIPAP